MSKTIRKHITALEHTLTNDILAKLMFVHNPKLLKLLVAVLLKIPVNKIKEFRVTNTEIPPESLGEKFCRLDINMVVNGQVVALEIQVRDEGDYPERSLYYWARDYSSSLPEGKTYADLPRTVVISIVSYNLFPDTTDFHSEFEVRETKRNTVLTDKLDMHYFELPKLPEEITAADKQTIWLALFAAKSEEDLEEILALGVPEMAEAVRALKSTATSSEFKELERLRTLARHNEASALAFERKKEAVKWQKRLAASDKKLNKKLADKEATIADKDATIADKDATIADKDATIAEQNAKLEKAMARLAELEVAGK